MRCDIKIGVVLTKKLPGVYAIRHIESGTTYFGGTNGPIHIRWNVHKCDLNANKAHNSYLQAAWNKYGAGAFECVVLENIESSPLIYRHEQAWIDMARLDGLKLYNLNYCVDVPYWLGKKRPLELVEKLAHSNRGRKHTKVARENMGRSHIGNKSRTGQTRSKEERQKTSASLKRAYAEGRRTREVSQDQRDKIAKTLSKPYPAFIHRQTGEIIPAGVGLKSMCKKRNIHSGNMCSVKTGKIKSCEGWEVL